MFPSSYRYLYGVDGTEVKDTTAITDTLDSQKCFLRPQYRMLEFSLSLFILLVIASED